MAKKKTGKNGTVTVASIKMTVEAIKLKAHDCEAAHGLEDSLHQSVLQAIANGQAEDPAECAREALKTRGLDFDRWYA
jgi:hypothetical protein